MNYIRKAKPEDLDSLRDIFYWIRKEEFPWESHIDRDDFDTSTQGEAIYIAEINETVVGFISIWEPDNFVHNLFVQKDARNCGIGIALLEYARAQQPDKPMTLKCVQDNQRAYHFYLNQGWSVLETVNDDEIPYYLMEWC